MKKKIWQFKGLSPKNMNSSYIVSVQDWLGKGHFDFVPCF